MKQMPNATKLGDNPYWYEKKKYVRRTERDNPILILEPRPYTKQDGTTGYRYNAKKCYDVSQTIKPEKFAPVQRTPHELFVLLETDSPAIITPVDDLGYTDKCAFYDHERKKIFIHRGISPMTAVIALAKELALAEFGKEDEYSRNAVTEFKADCVSYMVCRRYGVDTSSFKMFDIPNEIKQMESKDFRNELSSAREALNTIGGRIIDGLENQHDIKRRDYER